MKIDDADDFKKSQKNNNNQKQKQENKPVYIKIFPFRFVQPYAHIYKTFAKGRWLGKQLLAVLIKQFKAYPPQYYAKAIQNGNILVNESKVDPTYIIKNGDAIIHTTTRVQPPILNLPIDKIHDDQQFLVVNKPPSLTVHTGGGNHYNTLQNILRFEYGYQNLHVLHRLDKLTSGLLIFAKSKQNVGLFHEESQNEIMKKMYFARVDGQVKWQKKQLEAYIKCLSHKDGIYQVCGQINSKQKQQKQQKQQKDDKKQVKKQEIAAQKPLQLDTQIKYQQHYFNNNDKKIDKDQKINQKKYKKVKNVQAKQMINQIKTSKTYFKKIWYDEKTDSSLLECYPVTGRTHQIRVHLKYLGHPILNDTNYGGRFVGNNIIDFIQSRSDQQLQKPTKLVKMGQGLNIQQWDFKAHSWQIMLHSYSYRFGGRQFTSKLPYWHQKNAIKMFKSQ